MAAARSCGRCSGTVPSAFCSHAGLALRIMAQMRSAWDPKCASRAVRNSRTRVGTATRRSASARSVAEDRLVGRYDAAAALEVVGHLNLCLADVLLGDRDAGLELLRPPVALRDGVGRCPFAHMVGTVRRRIERTKVAVAEGADGGVPLGALDDDTVRLAAEDHAIHAVRPLRGQRGRDLVAGVEAQHMGALQPQRVGGMVRLSAIQGIVVGAGRGWELP